ncbi:MAG: VWA domain-containing protein [Neisseria sp.]|nr:VWA domain-containing protein [Neisseria sp.]
MVTTLQYAQLSSVVYHKLQEINKIKYDNVFGKPIDIINDPQTGFSCGIFLSGNQIVIAFTGTDDGKDWNTNVAAATHNPNYPDAAPQVKQAALVVAETLAKYPAASISLTGHSLGGGLASIMAVLFNLKAVVFDPAPFREGLIHSASIQKIISFLAKSGLSNSSLNQYIAEVRAVEENYPNSTHNFTALNNLEKNISGAYIKGEALEVIRGERTGIAVNKLQAIDIGSQDIGSITLHEINLLLAIKASSAFYTAVSQNSNILSMLYNDKLYARDRKTSKEVDILVKLINDQLSDDGQGLDNFGNDTLQLINAAQAQDFQQAWGKTGEKAVLAQMIEWYYTQENFKDKSFFQGENAQLLQYTVAQDTTHMAAQQFVRPFLDKIQNDKIYDVQDIAQISGAEQWNIAIGGIDAAAVDQSLTQFFLGSSGADTFRGAENAANLLLGGLGADTLIGGAKDDVLVGGFDQDKDILEGGDGNDTYYARANDVVIDSGGDGKVYFNDILLDKAYRDTENQEEEVYLSEDGALEYTLSEGNLTVKHLKSKSGEESITIQDFDKKERDLDIHLIDAPGKDVVFVIDVTGSMQDDIDIVKANVGQIINHLFSNAKQENLDTRIGILTYSDNNLRWVNISADTPQAAMSAINAVYEQGGGLERVAGSLLKALNEFKWRAGEQVSKEIYLFGDEQGDDLSLLPAVYARSQELKTTLDQPEKGIEGNSDTAHNQFIPIHAIALGSDGATKQVFKSISDNTSGLYFNPQNKEDLENALFDVTNTGTAGDDVIVGNDGNNTINGGKGSDILQGGTGSDTYVFNPSFGQDTIIETNPENADKNRIDLSDFNSKDFIYSIDQGNLIIKDNTRENTITVNDFFGQENKINTITFADKELSHQEIVLYAKLQDGKDKIVYLDDHQDYQAAWNKPVFVSAAADSKVKGSLYDDVVFGGSGHYEIETGMGQDTLVAGRGNGTLKGGFGNDIYIYGKNSEQVTIYDDAGQDALKLQGISLKDMILEKNQNDLVIKFSDSEQNQITVKDQFAWKLGYFNRIESIEFDDGSYITADKIHAAIKVYAQHSYGTAAYDAGKIHEELTQQGLIGYM